MVEDKIIPFTELDHEDMMNMRKEIFQPEFLKILDIYKDELSKHDYEIKIKIFDFLLKLMEDEGDPSKRVLMYKPILYGLCESLINCCWGMNKVMDLLQNHDKDKVE